jgi:transcriptional regulator with XRE-family HTH domain
MRSKAHYTREELAALLGLRVQTLAAWACRDRGPMFIKRGRRVRYRAIDVAAWLDDPTAYRTAIVVKKSALIVMQATRSRFSERYTDV